MLHIESTGRPVGPSVILLHGFLGSGRDWRGFARLLAGDARCLAVDLPGHGQSSADGARCSFDRTLRALAEVLAGAPPPVHVVGYSMGGRLAWALAARCAPAVAGLVVVSATPGLAAGSDRIDRTRGDDALADRLEAIGTTRFLREWYRQPLFRTVAARPGLLERLLRERGAGEARALAQALRGLSVGRQEPLWDRLPRLPMPVLAVAGAQDARYADILHRAAGLCPRGRLLIVPGAGHMPHLEQPSFFAARVGAFLREQMR